MSYEAQIGWRYLYRGSRSRRSAFGFLASAALAGLGAYLFFAQGDASGLTVAALVGGALAAIVFALLHVFSVFTTVSVMGVVLGVAALSVVLAVTTGFQQQFREKVLGVNAHVLVMKNTNDFAEYREIEEQARRIDRDVLAVQPFVFVEMLVTRGRGELAGVAIKGVDPTRVSSVLDLHKHMVEGSVESLATAAPPPSPAPATDAAPPIIMGKELARKLNAHIGDLVTVVSPLSHIDVNRWAPTGRPPKTKRFRVTGIFYAGFDEYDRRLMYIHLREAQDLLEQGDVVMGVEMRIRDVDRARAIADKLDAALGGAPYVVQDWRELNKNLFTALTLQKIALLIVLTLIIAVATFNMVSALTMMVIDKTREIAILKSMGATSGGVARIFQVVGLMIGGLGTALGLGLGLTVCEVVARFGYRLDPKVYLIDRLPIEVRPLEVLLVGVITMIISTLATLFPAGKASSLRPVDGLRYD
jgi:lipoprotein-releasing system permease protein